MKLFFHFQTDTGTNTSYNQTVTSTAFDAYHNEGGTATDLLYRTGNDSNQASGFQRITSSLVEVIMIKLLLE